MGTGDETTYLEYVLGKSSGAADGSYLESLLSTEDKSHPDKDMVLLWCMRNGLQHVEVSALEGMYDRMIVVGHLKKFSWLCHILVI